MRVLLFLGIDSDLVSGQRSIWQRRRTSLVSAVIIVSLLILAFGGVAFFWPGPASGTLVSFVCKPSSGNQAFIISARVNLTDGMDQEEAVDVASEVFQSVYLKPGENWKPAGAYTNVNSDENGTWTVEYIGFYSTPLLGHCHGSANQGLGGGPSGMAMSWIYIRKSMILIINPSDQTVEYTT